MATIEPWIQVEPSSVPAAILGPLPSSPRSVTYPIPSTVVPESANGIMVFAWYAVSGQIDSPGWWHFAVNLADGTQNWFALMIAGGSSGPPNVTACNSQAFWLPMPIDGALTVTLFNLELDAGAAFQGEVEIHGYYPPAGGWQ